MDANEVIDFYTSVMVVGTEKKPACRLDSGIDSVKSHAAATRTLVGLQCSCANTGILIGRIDQLPVITADLALLTALTQIVPMDIAIPVGQELVFHILSSTGTAAATVVAHCHTVRA